MGTEDWRRRRAEELFGNGNDAGPPRDRRVAGTDGILPMAPAGQPERRSPTVGDQRGASEYRARSPASAVSPVVPSAASPPSATPAAAPARRVAPLWALLAAIALIAGGAIGWLARGSVGAPANAPTPSVAVPVAPPQISPPSIAAGPTEPVATVAPEPEASKPAEPKPAPEAEVPAPEVAPPVAAARPVVPRYNPTVRNTGRAPDRNRRVAERAVDRRRAVAQAVAETPQRTRIVRDQPRNGAAPGFNCRRARNDVTAAICSDAGLAALDRQLTSRFAALDRSADPATVQRIHHGETTFLNARQTCPDRDCIADAYRLRLRELDEAGR